MSAVKIVFNHLPEISRRLSAATSAEVRAAAFEIEAGVKAEMSTPKSGVTYGDHQASAPGEAPAVDTGAYLNDVRAQVDGQRAIVGTNQEQAAILEYGGEAIAARPVWRKVAKQVEEAFIERVRNLERGLR